MFDIFFLLYLINYSIISILFFNLLSLSGMSNLTNQPLYIFLQNIKTYTLFWPLWAVGFLSLSGIPPFGVFYLKIILLINIIPQLPLGTFFFIFCGLVVTMLFYLQFFRLTTLNKSAAFKLHLSLKNTCATLSSKQHTKGLSANKYWVSLYQLKYTLCYFCVLITIFISLFGLFGLDLYFILLNLIN